MKVFLYIVIFLAFISVVYLGYRSLPYAGDDGLHACTAEAKMCPDGTAVGREGPNCEFAACPTSHSVEKTPIDVFAEIEAKKDLIVVEDLEPYDMIESPLSITGQARGYWYFEGSFSVHFINSEGEEVSVAIATADDEWMTEEFVPFTATLEFETPEIGARGVLQFRKANASGLPEHDDVLEIPVMYAEEELIAI